MADRDPMVASNRGRHEDVSDGDHRRTLSFAQLASERRVVAGYRGGLEDPGRAERIACVTMRGVGQVALGREAVCDLGDTPLGIFTPCP
ncbi:hypothetical protein [Actinospica robiniae]|uniref:hypothetical protein n=1 Tax=Actinospica robiniae TaxID=304901 RepID=UPI0012FB89BE|nr:hypothetical protein [Actinospica robiniae]